MAKRSSNAESTTPFPDWLWQASCLLADGSGAVETMSNLVDRQGDQAYARTLAGMKSVLSLLTVLVQQSSVVHGQLVEAVDDSRDALSHELQMHELLTLKAMDMLRTIVDLSVSLSSGEKE